MKSTNNPKVSRTARAVAGGFAISLALALTSGGAALARSNDAPPQVAPSATCAPTAITTGTVNMRTGPATTFPIITVIPIGMQVPVTGRNVDATWYQVVFNGQQGWSSADFLRVSCGQNVPVVTNPTNPPATPPPTTPPPPSSTNATITASPTTINFGGCTTLAWNTAAASQVFLGYGAMLVPVGLTGTRQVCPAVSTRFYLQVTANNGTVSKFPVDVTVNNPYNPANFRSNAYVVNPGQCPTLSWNVQNVNAVYLISNNGQTRQGVAGEGSQQVCVSSPTSYILQVIDTNGQPTNFTVTINILNQPPGNVQMVLNPTTVTLGQCANLQWLAGNARSVQLVDTTVGSTSNVGNTGNLDVCPTYSGSYTIRATLLDGSTAQQTQNVTVVNPDGGVVSTRP